MAGPSTLGHGPFSFLAFLAPFILPSNNQAPIRPSSKRPGKRFFSFKRRDLTVAAAQVVTQLKRSSEPPRKTAEPIPHPHPPRVSSAHPESRPHNETSPACFLSVARRQGFRGSFSERLSTLSARHRTATPPNPATLAPAPEETLYTVPNGDIELPTASSPRRKFRPG